jgi:hypothetical protein
LLIFAIVPPSFWLRAKRHRISGSERGNQYASVMADVHDRTTTFIAQWSKPIHNTFAELGPVSPNGEEHPSVSGISPL